MSNEKNEPKLELTLADMPGALKINQYLLSLREQALEHHETDYYSTLTFLTSDLLDAMQARMDSA